MRMPSIGHNGRLRIKKVMNKDEADELLIFVCCSFTLINFAIKRAVARDRTREMAHILVITW
jgi:hypothetical protein